jgi:hypothetical protein
MAEVKNSFLQSKMNKDLDDRLIPNGQYRDALNISVGKAEDQDVGALEVELGNEFMVDTFNSNLVCIGKVTDNQNNRVFQFWTDYFAPDNDLYAEPSYGNTYDMRITMYTPNDTNGVLQTLVSGSFLNFAANKQFAIIGANVLENLLFWTDNRNQPRKINITTALSNPNYYYNEVQISVAKYAPIQPISVYSNSVVTTTTNSVTPSLPGDQTTLSFKVSNADAEKLSVGMYLIDAGLGISIDDFAIIINIIPGTTESTIVLTIPITSPPISISSGSSLNFQGTTMSNQSENPDWAGDPNFLKDKYIRFSYRYKFDDGEYSLMAPFTQIMFIPNQAGFFLNGDENEAYRSTVVSWMENYINNIILKIKLPDTGNNITNSYKISAIDILYKESDSNNVKVVETIKINEIALIAGNTNDYEYIYQSQKPYKTLPESQTVRVYDKVPIRARAQETTSNRVVYGNIVNKSTPPNNIDYNVAVIKKRYPNEAWAEYPNHTLKQNRNYQVGFVLADKFGRQSSVILSSNDLLTSVNGEQFGGSTIYSPYYNADDNLNTKEWRGNTLAVLVNAPITSTINQGTGTPGLYATISGINGQNNQGFEITAATITTVGSQSTYTYTLAGGTAQGNFPTEGNYVRGKYTDYVKVLPGAYSGYLQTDGVISDFYLYDGTSPDIKYAYDINNMGWYSYKVVVRQQQQDYYNVYLPGMLNGYPMWQTTTAPGTYPTPSANPTIFPANETNRIAHVVLINDNINKIPRDLSEVGPDQKQYRSSVQLFGRVENMLYNTGATNNKQYYPSKNADTTTTIANSSDLTFLPLNSTTNQYGTASNNFYQLSTNPMIARISTINEIGVIGTTETGAYLPPNTSKTMNPFLGIYETTPDVTLLELFWETTTSGLISDLNADIIRQTNATFDFKDFVYEQFESYLPTNWVTTAFTPIDNQGNTVTTIDSMSLSVVDAGGANRTGDFDLVDTGGNTYRIRIVSPFVWLTNSSFKENYTFTFNIIDVTNGNSTITKYGSLQNSVPVVTFPNPVSPETIYLDDPPAIGPVYTCVGDCGAPSVVGDPGFNTQQLKWEILPSSTTNYDTYFNIDPITGNINVINNTMPSGEVYTLDISLTDTYDYTLNTPGTGSLSTTFSINFTRNAYQNYCAKVQSLVVQETNSRYTNKVTGTMNFWRMLLQDEWIDTANTTLIVNDYISAAGNPYSQPFSGHYTNPPLRPNNNFELWFDNTNDIYEAQFEFYQDQGLYDFSPVGIIHIQGLIRTNSPWGAVRELPVNAYITMTNIFLNSSNTDNCSANYISPTKKAWKLTNPSASPIAFTALLDNGVAPLQILQSILFPGQEASSTNFFGGTYSCIRENSLTFNYGGVVEYGTC